MNGTSTPSPGDQHGIGATGLKVGGIPGFSGSSALAHALTGNPAEASRAENRSITGWSAGSNPGTRGGNTVEWTGAQYQQSINTFNTTQQLEAKYTAWDVAAKFRGHLSFGDTLLISYPQ